jgi:rhodanese-related sulfurtransferase
MYLRKWIVAGTLLVLAAGAAPVWAGSSAQAMIAADNAADHRPDAKEARKLYDAGATFVDVRTDREWSGGYVKDAKHSPVNEVKAEAAAKLPDQTLPIVTYCAAGPRAAKAAATLRKLGYRNVTAMTGGYSDWKDANNPIALPR